MQGTYIKIAVCALFTMTHHSNSFIFTEHSVNIVLVSELINVFLEWTARDKSKTIST